MHEFILTNYSTVILQVKVSCNLRISHMALQGFTAENLTHMTVKRNTPHSSMAAKGKQQKRNKL